MRQRVFGTENEYAVILETNNPPPYPSQTEVLSDKLAALLLRTDGKRGCLGKIKNLPAGRLWLPNGGCTYIDVGKPEYATPECARVKDLVAHNKAGERIVYGIWGEPAINGDRIIIIKNTVARSGDPHGKKYVSYGAHENYMTYGIGPLASETYPPLFPFFVTRQILDGSGWWKNPEEDVFHLSQRAEFIQNECSTTATQCQDGYGVVGSRPLVLLRNEDFTGDWSGMHRSQFVFSDANMLECALYLKIGTMMLGLSMLEHRVLPKIKMENAIAVLHTLSETGDMWSKNVSVIKTMPTNMTGATEHRMQTSVLDIQKEYCSRAKDFVRSTRFENEELENESMEIVLLWEQTLDALYRKDWDWLSGRLDWVTKRAFVEKVARARTTREQSAMPSLPEIRERVDILYHEIGPRGMEKPLRVISQGKRIVTDAEIERAVEYPPSDTRAKIREALVRRELKDLRPKADTLNWNRVTFSNNKQEFMNDPLQTTTKWLESLLASDGESTL